MLAFRESALALAVSLLGAACSPARDDAPGAAALATPFHVSFGSRDAVLRAELDADQLVLAPAGRATPIHLRLARLGGAAVPAAAAIQQTADRHEVDRGSLVEWYAPVARGIEQGFTVEQAPPDGAALRIELDVDAEIAPVEGSAALDLVARDGSWTARYGELHAFDAGGRELPSRLSAVNGAIRLDVDAAGAAYPVVVDPLIFVQMQKLLASDGVMKARFGDSLDVEGDTAFIGAPSTDPVLGKAYEFTRTGSTWTEGVKLFGSSVLDDEFGSCVALSGDTLLVGEWRQDRAYVYVRSGNVWSQQAMLSGSNAFGMSCDLWGDQAIVSQQGGARIFVRTGTIWNEEGAPAVAANFTTDRYVGISGGIAAVGAEDTSGNKGAVHVYERSGTTWPESAVLTPSDTTASIHFGRYVAMHGSTIVAGSFFTQNVYIYEKQAGTWVESIITLPGGNNPYSVGVDATRVAVGVPGAFAAGTFRGSVFVYSKAGGTWALEQQPYPATFPALSFGNSVAIAADRLFVGSYTDDTQGSEAGAVYVYELRSSLGDSCAAGLECASGICVDGVCCDSACTGACQACTAAKKGGGAEGVCAFVALGSDPDDDCADLAPSSCSTTGSCDGAGGCLLYSAGVVCGAPSCLGFSDAQPAATCDGSGTCNQPASGPCASGFACVGQSCVTSCNGDALCVPDHYCDGSSCVPDAADGAVCTAAGHCQSDHCVVGVCCSSACTAGCETCAATPGTCTLAAAGTTGRCGDYACDGVSTTCPASCADDSGCASTAYCTANAGCEPGRTAGQPCDPTSDCAAPPCAVCATGTTCVDGVCCAGASSADCNAVGVACAAGDECATGFCADGFCCESACSGQCEACDVAGSEGACIAVSGAPRPDRAECPVGASPCEGRLCDGATRDACEAYVGPDVECRAATCAAGTQTLRAHCDGQGACPSPETHECAPYACGVDACLTACAASDDCQSGTQCDPATSRCIAGGTCKDAVTAVDGNGAEIGCFPYRCESGECGTHCTSSGECASGTVCDPASGECQVVHEGTSAAASGDDSGCGCRAPGHGPSRLGWVVALLGVLALGRRSRRCSALLAAGAVAGVAGCDAARERERTVTAAAPLVGIPGQEIQASDSTSGNTFGTSVTIEGATWVVGAAGAQVPGGMGTLSGGAAYVYALSAGSWTEIQKLSAPSPESSDAFGVSVALSGSTLVVGASSKNDLATDAGRAFVFERSGGTFGAALPIEPGGTAASDAVGRAVAIDGDTILVGAPMRDEGATDAGAAFAFFRNGAAWTEQGTLALASGVGSHSVGASVAISGDTAVVGAPTVNSSGLGEAFVFVRSGTSWSYQGALTPPTPVSADGFGVSVAVLGDRAVVGAPFDDVAASNAGAVHVFERSGTSWTHVVALRDLTFGPQRRIGTSVSIAANAIVAGAPTNASGQISAAYLYVLEAGSWVEQPWMQSAVPQSGDQFGTSIDMDPARVVVGASDAMGVGRAVEFVLLGSNGAACGAASECASDFCVDSVCCDAPCAGVCVACTAAKKGSGADGACGAIPFGADPDSECPADAESSCDRTGTCSGAASCSLYSLGATCEPSTCVSATEQTDPGLCDGAGTCVPGASQLCQTGHACSNGSCSSACSTSVECAPAYHCAAGACVLDFAVGDPCDENAQCASDACADGICCEHTCDGACERCEAGGTCTLSAAGSPGAPSCSPLLCDGVSADCLTSCATDADCTAGRFCTAAGACVFRKAPGQSCDPAAECAVSGCNPCAGDASCVDGTCCEAVGASQCLGLGESCSTVDACASRHCTDGVCCDAPCAGQCEACGANGECAPVIGAPAAGRAECPTGSTAEPCLARECDGVNRVLCARFVGAEVTCADPKCEGGEASGAAVCSGAGACAAPERHLCSPYVCGADACLDACSSDDDCTPGYACDGSAHKCISAVRCKDATTVVDETGVERSCAPYTCGADGCLEKCSSTNDCAAGYVCDPAASICATEPSGAAAEESGCGCRTTTRGDATPPLVPAVVALVLAARRRRRSAR